MSILPFWGFTFDATIWNYLTADIPPIIFSPTFTNEKLKQQQYNEREALDTFTCM